MTSTVSTKPASSAWAIFNDHSFSFETLRAPGYAPYGGADIGEVTSTASRIPDGDKTAWYSEWRALAERIHADADRSAAEGHPCCELGEVHHVIGKLTRSTSTLIALAPTVHESSVEGRLVRGTCPRTRKRQIWP
jgi:hypothetical protein